MTTVEWIKNDSAFREQLLRGRKTEERVAFDLLMEGFTVGLGRCEFRATFDDRHDFSDEKDIVVAPGHVLEVKSRGIAFTSAEDYPYDTAFVCATRRWKARQRKPCAVILHSEKTGERLIVPASTRSHWKATNFYDSARGFNEEAFEITRDRLRPWSDLLEHLTYGCGEFGVAA